MADLGVLRTAALGLAALSFVGIGLMMAGSFLWQEEAERYKKLMPQVILGLVIIMIASGLVAFFGG